jgi:hypothetical protein
MRREPGGVDPDLPHPREVALEQLTISGKSLRVVGSPPEMFRFSTALQNGWAIAGSSWASVMSDLRSPCFQLLHISHSRRRPTCSCR